MRLKASSALVVALSTTISGTSIAPQVLSCNEESLSNAEQIFHAQLEKAFEKACSAGKKDQNSNFTTIDSAPFKLSINGALPNMDLSQCISAFEDIQDYCTTDDIFGGSTTSQGVKFTIDRSTVIPDLHTLEARAGDKKAKAGGAAKAKADKTKHTGAKANKDLTDEEKKAKKDAKKAAKDAKRAGRKKQKAENTKKHKKPTTSYRTTCDQKKGTLAGGHKTSSKTSPAADATKKTHKKTHKRELTGRSILLDLIQRSLAKRGEPKPVNTCGKQLWSGPYWGPTDLVLKTDNNVDLYGFSTHPKLSKWFADSLKNVDTEEGYIGGVDTEHVAEWHNVGNFYNQRGGDTCKILDELLPNSNAKGTRPEPQKTDCRPVLTVNWKDEGKPAVDKTDTFSNLHAWVYPSKTRYVHEFVLLKDRANKPMKVNIFSGRPPISDENFDKDPGAIINLRDALTVGLYLAHPRIRLIFSEQVTRQGLMMAKIEEELRTLTKHADWKKKKLPLWKRTGGGLKKQWLTYMKKTWIKAVKLLTDFMHAKVNKLATDHGCGFQSHIASAAKTEVGYDESKLPDKPTDDSCEFLAFIHDTWQTEVKGKIEPFPTAGGVGGGSGGGNAGDPEDSGDDEPSDDDDGKPKPKTGQPPTGVKRPAGAPDDDDESEKISKTRSGVAFSVPDRTKNQ